MTRPGPLAGKWGPALSVVRIETRKEPAPIVIPVRDKQDLDLAMAAWTLLARLAERQKRGIAVKIERDA